MPSSTTWTRSSRRPYTKSTSAGHAFEPSSTLIHLTLTHLRESLPRAPNEPSKNYAWFVARHLTPFVLVTAALFLAAPALAQVNYDNSDIPAAFGLGTNTNVRAAVLSVVSFILTFLGLAAVLIVLYAGYLWMTAAGNEQRVESAKSTLTAGVIGLVIILAAYAITAFIIDTTVTQVTFGP